MGGSKFGRLAGSAAFILFGTVVSMGLSFGIRVVLARLLGSDGYGVVVLGFTVATLVAIVAKSGLPRGVARELPRRESESERRDVALSGLTLGLCLGSGLGVLLYAFSPLITTRVFDDQRLTFVLQAFSFIVPFIVIRSIAVSIFRGYNRTGERVLLNNFLAPVARFVLIVSAVALGYEVGGAAVAWVIGAGITAIAALVLLHRRIGVFVRDGYEPQHRSLLAFSLPLMLSAAIWNVVQQADNLLLGYFSTASIVGQYDIAFTLAKLLLAVITAFGFLFMPIFSELHAEENAEAMNRFYNVTAKWAASLAFPLYLVALLFPATILSTAFGPEYASADGVLRIISTGFFFHILSGLSGNALIAIGRTRTILLCNLAIVALNTSLNVALIPAYGIEGAAIASAISYSGLNLLYIRTLRKYDVFPFSLPTLAPLGITGVLVLLPWLILRPEVIGEPLGVVLFIALTAVIYLPVYVLSGGVQRADVEVLVDVENSVGRRFPRMKRLLVTASERGYSR
ncbi:hypothetical protein BRD03_02230 [Halobacteriales archaeon QS_9_68_17]|nr:MAG: hypothetical protein BRD03_02230 [Halobacteriales archaeon QS_9_68_17]